MLARSPVNDTCIAPRRRCRYGRHGSSRNWSPALGCTGRGSAAAVIPRARSGMAATTVPVPDLRVVNDLAAVGLQPCSHVLRRPGGGSRSIDADGEDVIGHRVSQQGGGIHGTKGCGLVGLVSSWPAPRRNTCWPELRPRGQVVGVSVAPSLPTNRNPVLRQAGTTVGRLP